ncbi:MAG: ATP-binding protein [Bacteroidota bacterium]
MPNERFVFRPRARTVILIGEELIKDDIIAVLELVKNAYDADATTVTIEINPGGKDQIIITDNGTGMTREDILHKWLEPATAWKAEPVGSKKRRSGSGRVMLGEKGVGRFAAHRLGRRLSVRTKAASEPLENRLEIDWRQYDDPDKYLDEVENRFYQHPLAQRSHGTVLEIQELRSKWDKAKVLRLAMSLMRLRDPFWTYGPFGIRLTWQDEEVDTTDIITSALNEADYTLEGEISEAGLLIASVKGDLLPDDLRRLKQVDLCCTLKREERADLRESCGPFGIRLYVWERRRADKARLLDEFGGVSVYRDGFRILPYGEPGYDWLGIDKGQIIDVGRRLSSRQVIGFVSISQDRNPELRDKTNREGLIEGDAYRTFRTLVRQTVIALQQARNKRLTEYKHEREAKLKAFPTVNVAFRTIRKYPSVPSELKELVDRAETRYSNETQQWRTQLRGLEELASIGLVVEITSHELGLSVGLLSDATVDLEKALHGLPEAPDRAMKLCSQIRVYAAELGRQMKLIEPFYRAARRTKKELNVADLVNNVLYLFERRFSQEGVRTEVVEKSVLRVRENPGLLQACLVNLLDNASYWLAVKNPGGKIIRITVDGHGRTMIVEDNGPGILPEDEGFVFEQFFTRKPDGRGLGLFITRDVLKRSGHSVELVTDPSKKSLPGAAFMIRFGDEE